MSFITGTQTELLWAMNAPVTKNTYTTEAAFTGVLGTQQVCAVPAGYFLNDNPNPVGRGLFLHVEGTIANTAAATFAVNLGFDPTAGTKANSIAVYAATAPTASVTAPWHCEIYYTCTAFVGSQMTLQVNGFWEQENVASGAALSSGRLTGGFSGSISGATMDPRVTNYIELFGTWSASSASNTTTVQQMLLFGLN